MEDDRASPSQPRADAWAGSAGQDWAEKAALVLMLCSLAGGHWGVCLTATNYWEKGALMHIAVVRVHGSPCSGTKHWLTSRVPQGAKVLHSSPRAGDHSGRIFPDKHNQEELLSCQKGRGEAQNGGWGENQGYWGSMVDFFISCRCCTKATCHILLCGSVCDRALQMGQWGRWKRQSFSANHREFAKGYGCLLSASSWPRDYGCTDHYLLIKA